MRFVTLDEVREGAIKVYPGDQIAFQDKEGKVRKGTVRIRKIKCGKKNCTKCPHERYAYAQYRLGKKVKEKYIGAAR